MLKRGNRFHGRGSLRYVYKHGKTVRSSDIALRYSPNQKRSSFRCAVVVSKKVEKSAVKRNKIRRRISAVIRQNAAAVDQPYDIVITVFSATVAELPPQELQKIILVLMGPGGDCQKIACIINSPRARTDSRR